MTTLQAYLSQQEHYFSESEGRVIPLDEMAVPHLAHAYRKLERELGDMFKGTPLEEGMLERVRPHPSKLWLLLAEHGHVASIYFDAEDEARVRRRMYHAGRYLGKRITTHIDRKLGLMKAEVVTPVVTVRGAEMGGK